MPVTEMVARPSLPITERTKAFINDSAQTRKPASPPDKGRRECVPRRPVILDAFDKVIEYDDRNLCPM